VHHLVRKRPLIAQRREMRNEYSSRRPVACMITSSDFGRAETLRVARHPGLTINRD
jgi:hypothetical protein